MPNPYYNKNKVVKTKASIPGESTEQIPSLFESCVMKLKDLIFRQKNSNLLQKRAKIEETKKERIQNSLEMKEF